MIAGSWVEPGPARQTLRTGTARTAIDLTDPRVVGPWQSSASRARTVGFVTANAVPVRLRGRVIGAPGLFRSEPGRLRAEDVLLARAPADVATVAVLQQRTLADSGTGRARLQYALTSRIVVEQGKGILAGRRRVPLDDAFAALRSYARANRLQSAARARDIAERGQGRSGVVVAGSSRSGHGTAEPAESIAARAAAVARSPVLMAGPAGRRRWMPANC
ncbi:ANTAR domain-containing protein [Kitasatospora purpeofusca]|uniref:ANTAR domain-containing protein n=1 Tax=Kitasatospora purpeofusca TaxID=67352 RepID=UPI0035DA54B8